MRFAFIASLNVSSIAKVQTPRRAVELALFPKLQQTLKNENPNNNSVEFPLNTDCCLAKIEKIRIDAATSCKEKEFSMPLREATSIVWIVFSAESSDFSRGTKSLKLSGISVRNIQSNRPLLDPFTRKYSSTCDSSLAFHLFFVSRVSLRNDFSKPDFNQRSIHGPACPGP